MVMEKRRRQLCLSRIVGEVVEISGDHVVRATGRKDRHSKVYTAKGPRDRRLRLSANTAIQFYDVQDRLGYDRPSKAVDWLMQNAKSAIDQLASGLPACNAPGDQGPASDGPIYTASLGYDFVAGGYGEGGFFSASLEREAMEYSGKPFPRALTVYTPNALFNPGGRTRDIRLSLQSFHEPISLQQTPDSTEQSLCPGAAARNKARMAWWNESDPCGSSGSGSSGEFACNAAGAPAPAPALFINSQFQLCTQRESLQSSNLPSSLRAWTCPTAVAAAQTFTPESFYGGFSGFNVPAQIQGVAEHQNRVAAEHSAQMQQYKTFQSF